MKKLLSIIMLIICSCALFAGCVTKENTETTNNTNENGSTVTEIILPQKHTILLTINNYSTYIETSFAVGRASMSEKVTFTANGCLSYAYYENVVFEIEHDGEKILVACNAAGNGNGSYSGRNIGTITAISGNVIYWM